MVCHYRSWNKFWRSFKSCSWFVENIFLRSSHTGHTITWVREFLRIYCMTSGASKIFFATSNDISFVFMGCFMITFMHRNKQSSHTTSRSIFIEVNVRWLWFLKIHAHLCKVTVWEDLRKRFSTNQLHGDLKKNFPRPVMTYHLCLRDGF